MLFDTHGNAVYQNTASLQIHGYTQARLTREALAATWTGWDGNGDPVPFERSPLNAIIGFTTLVLERVTGEINAEQEHQLSIVKRSAH
jgi:hypothetical protein